MDRLRENDASGHVFIKSFGRSGMFMGVFCGAPSPLALEHKASVILPILAMRLELASATRARVELESRKSVLNPSRSSSTTVECPPGRISREFWTT